MFILPKDLFKLQIYIYNHLEPLTQGTSVYSIFYICVQVFIIEPVDVFLHLLPTEEVKNKHAVAVLPLSPKINKQIS